MGDTAAKTAINLAKKAANNKEVQKGAAAAALWVGKLAGGVMMATRRNRKQAQALARQVGAKYSEGTIIANRERFVVWKAGKAIACFPPLTPEQLNGGKLCDCDELQGFDKSLLKAPPPLKTTSSTSRRG
jgi:hypothetical protein